MSKKSIGVKGHIGILILRLGIGILFITHGLPKLQAGPDKWESIGQATQYLGINFLPTFFGFMAAISEFLGGILLIIGLLTRYAATFMLITMMVAISYHMANNEGFELATAYAIVTFCFILIGAGRFSIDRYFLNKR